jgi:hypothetical protein
MASSRYYILCPYRLKPMLQGKFLGLFVLGETFANLNVIVNTAYTKLATLYCTVQVHNTILKL